MGDAEDCPPSPPLSRGTYNINFDELDLDAIDPFKSSGGLGSSPGTEIGNPFQSKAKIATSPPKQSQPISIPPTKTEPEVEDIDPFQSKSKIGQSPPIHTDNGEDPFKTKTNLGQSPPVPSDFSEGNVDNNIETSEPNGIQDDLDVDPFQSRSKVCSSPVNIPAEPSKSQPPGDTAVHDNAVANDNVESDKTADESPEKSNKGLKTRSKSRTPPTTNCSNDTDQPQAPNDVDQDGGSEPVKHKPEKKSSSPKKSGIKKPKARSKFKPPPNFGVQDSEDVVIFAPPPPNTQTANHIDMPTADIENEAESIDNQPINNEVDNNLPNQMTTSEMIGRVSDMIDSVHDFGAGEMPMENNEEFVPASEAFNEDEAWDMMQNMKHENGVHPRDSISTFDPLVDEQVPDKVTRRVSETALDGNSLVENEDLMLMSTPPQAKQHSGSSRGVSRHPAARALQEHVDGDGAPREAPHVIDKMLFSPVKGEEGKPRMEGDERYFDALEYPTRLAAQ